MFSWGLPRAANTLNGRLNAFRSRCFWMRQGFRTCKVRVPEGCLQPEEIRRGAPACGKRRYPVSIVKKAKRIPPRILCGIFCALAEETELKGFLVVRVSALSTYAEGLPLCGKRRYPVSVVKKAKRISSPHTMRDFLCFGGGDRDEEVPCGSRA